MTKNPDVEVDPAPALPEPRPNVPIHSDSEDRRTWSRGARFASSDVWLSRLAGAEQIHVNKVTLAPGRQGGPFHYHVHEEEHFYILEGRCVLRSGDDRHEMKPGDYVCFPAGTGVAHAFENPFDTNCSLLAIGQWNPGEIAVYADSGKAKLRALDTVVKWPQPTLDYWDGENTDEVVRQ